MIQEQDNMLALPEPTDRFFAKGPVRLFSAQPCPWRWMAVCNQPTSGILIQECPDWMEREELAFVDDAAAMARYHLRAAS